MSFSRRLFLKSTAPLLLAPVWPRLSAAASADGAAGMQLGLVTYNWGKDWDIPTLIKNCSETGFSGVELRTTHAHGVELSLNPQQRAEIRKQFADSPVAVAGLGSTCEYHSPDPDVVRKNLEETKEWVRLSHDIGGSGVKVRPNALPKGVPTEKTLEQIGRAMQAAAEYAADFGQEIRMEVHGAGTKLVPNMKTIMNVATHPNAVVCWNCNPSDLDGEGFAANFAMLKNRIGTVHIHNLTIDDYPWKELFDGLKSVNFQGWTLMEENREPSDILGEMKRNRAAWDQLAHS